MGPILYLKRRSPKLGHKTLLDTLYFFVVVNQKVTDRRIINIRWKCSVGSRATCTQPNEPGTENAAYGWMPSRHACQRPKWGMRAGVRRHPIPLVTPPISRKLPIGKPILKTGSDSQFAPATDKCAIVALFARTNLKLRLLVSLIRNAILDWYRQTKVNNSFKSQFWPTARV